MVGGCLLQLLLAASEPAPRARYRRSTRWQVGAEHPGPSGEAHGSSLDTKGAYELHGAARRDTKKTRTEAKVAGGGGVCSLSTVYCGTTPGLALESICLFGAGADLDVPKAAGVVLIVIGGVPRY